MSVKTHADIMLGESQKRKGRAIDEHGQPCRVSANLSLSILNMTNTALAL